MMKRDDSCCPLSELLSRLKTSSANCNERLEASDALIAEVERELVEMRCPVTVKVKAGRGYVEWVAGYWHEWVGFGSTDTVREHKSYMDGSLRVGPNVTFGMDPLKHADAESRILAAAQLKRLLSEAQLKAKAFAMAAEGV